MELGTFKGMKMSKAIRKLGPFHASVSGMGERSVPLTIARTFSITSAFGGPKRDLGGGFRYFLFSPLLGEMIQFDKYSSNGLKAPTRDGLWMFLGHLGVVPAV